jgi:hypothetical protein
MQCTLFPALLNATYIVIYNDFIDQGMERSSQFVNNMVLYIYDLTGKTYNRFNIKLCNFNTGV